jgi:hypothetical protein
MHNGLWLIGLLITPGLFALALLMAWLETRLTQNMVKYDVNKAWTTAGSPEEIEELVRASAARLRIDRAHPIYPTGTGGANGNRDIRVQVQR